MTQQLQLKTVSLNRGITLVEMIVVLAIIGILALVALPSFSAQIKNDRITSNANQLQSVVKFARSEAAKRDQQIDLVVAGSKWLVKIDKDTAQERTLAEFSPTHPSITVNNLQNMTITNTGAMTAATLMITDNDNQTDDRLLCIFISGQTLLTKAANCL
ncbi:GspH/FimT family pseudopilin [Shewanella pneumatophori]|uniref:Type II secretion system protein H n=1 Tax=Shewanella pneumatophori TaxID=314092 RepID=A0A9X1ZFM9_9GAMM|nr:prepilin-type N-terminal cleavage/methylation domain-containing protein [Shewanella pneumatophori]MCL1139012.1 prepilin-type N-terminal cleavage/methylation domain-containing protein [Shewanella pneumatophori]